MDVHLATAMTCTSANGRIDDAGTAFHQLFDGVDDLIKRVADSENPEIRKIRAKVHASLAGAKSAWESGAQSHGHPDDEQGFPAEDEDEDPAFGVALLVGVGLGMIMSIQP